MLKNIPTLLTLAIAIAPAVAQARPIAEYESVLNLAPRVEDRSILRDIEDKYPYVAPNGAIYQPQAINNQRTANLTNHQKHCGIVRRYVTQTSAEKCVYATPYKGSEKISAPTSGSASLSVK